MRTAVYARYSTELQDARSIEDQHAVCRKYAADHELTVVAEYADAAVSGATMAGRDGLAKLIHAAEARLIDAVLCESLDRLSRSLADIASLHEQLAFLGVRIVTISDGEVNKLHVGLRGTINAIYLSDLAQKTKRGQLGRVKAGRIPGGHCYGYDVVSGEDRGRRTIDQAEAEIVRRIYREYVAGRSPKAIVTDLNREGIPAPRGGKWNASTLNGNRQRANGILSNSLYVGRLRFDRQKFVKDPKTGKRQARPNAQGEWVEQEIPELRIIDDDLWQAAQAMRATNTRRATFGRNARRPKRVLSGLLRCGMCGESYIVVTKDHVACSGRQNKGVCDNARTMRMAEIEQRVLTALQTHLLSPELAEAAVEAYRLEREQRDKQTAKGRRALERELADTKGALERVLDMVCKGIGEQAELGQRMKDLAARKREIEAVLSSAKQTVVTIHPQAAQRYRAKVAEIQEALTRGDAASQGAVALVRSMIECIVITPQPDRMALEVFGELSMLLGNTPSTEGELPDCISGCGGWIWAMPYSDRVPRGGVE
jgi:DNA invertase Pin-like site-specific DNA recombinase